jgi:hypothetical protein
MEFDFDKLLLPLASSMVGLIPVLIKLTADWADRKSKTARLNTFLQQTNHRVGFLNTWFNLQKEVSSPEQLSQIRNKTPLKRFLLIYQPYNTRGWLFHTLFYMSILPLVVGLGYVIFQFVQTQAWMQNIPQEYLYGDVALLSLMLIFRWLGRRAAKEIEERLATLARKTAPLRASID